MRAHVRCVAVDEILLCTQAVVEVDVSRRPLSAVVCTSVYPGGATSLSDCILVTHVVQTTGLGTYI